MVRKTNTAGVYDHRPGKAADEGTVNVRVDGELPAESSVNRFEISIGRFRRGCAPRTFRAGVYLSHSTMNVRRRQGAQPGEALQRLWSERHFIRVADPPRAIQDRERDPLFPRGWSRRPPNPLRAGSGLGTFPQGPLRPPRMQSGSRGCRI